ncbi:Synaptotagmin-14 Synaptotagmin XIV [Collichthys lucidus]|uniref:Synaptotagmin-14 Synaptotagmin XIV n=1 Tax=Collichthys lucidus TaxID=240159 RepID=A0A4U5UKW9_COLLU|nr:Synaptotagmin-14 Synaptotagmin XIV [Collichthys lucidus]
MAIDGGGRNCGVHELICARRVSPELLGVLSSIAAFMVLMAVFFLYLSNKLSVESPDDLSHLGGYKSNQPAHTVMLAPHPANDHMSVSVPLMS